MCLLYTESDKGSSPLLPTIILAIALTGCAIRQTPIRAIEDLGILETVVSGSPTYLIRNKIIQGCYKNDLEVEDKEDIICSKELSGTEEYVAEVTLGSIYSATPRINLQFQLENVQDDVKVNITPSYSVKTPDNRIYSVQIKSLEILNRLRKLLEV